MLQQKSGNFEGVDFQRMFGKNIFLLCQSLLKFIFFREPSS